MYHIFHFQTDIKIFDEGKTVKKQIGTSIGGLLFVALSYIFLYLPILTLILFSFNAKRFPAPWDHCTLKWYQNLFHTQEIWLSLGTSLCVALLSTSLSLGMGVLLLFFKAIGGNIRKAIPFFYGNLIIPETMLALSLVSYFSLCKIELGMTTLVAAHTVLGLGFVIPILYTRYLHLDQKLSEVSQVLGATQSQTFFKVTLPLLRPTLIAIGLLTFVLSFDDFIISYFCAGTSVTTFSVYLLSTFRLGIDPTINALATFLILFSSLLVILFFAIRSVGGIRFKELGLGLDVDK